MLGAMETLRADSITRVAVFRNSTSNCIGYEFANVYSERCGSGGANITKASNGQIDSANEPGYRRNVCPSQLAVVAGVRI